MAKKKTPPRGKNGRFLSKAARAARARARKGHKGGGGGGHRKGHARSTAASSAAAAARSTARETAHQRRSRAARKGARTRARNAGHHHRPRSRGMSREAVAREARAAARAAARDIVTRGTERRGGQTHRWHKSRQNRFPAGHPRAGQFKGVRPGSGSVQDNPAPLLAAAENPLGMAEWLVGGFSLAVGAFGSDLLDRTVATTALTDTGTKDAAGNELYTDTNNPTSSSYAGMTNAAATAAPMNIWRWVFGGAAAIVPMAAGGALQHYTADGWPKTQAFLNFSGLGAFGRLIVKSGTDLAAYLLKGTGFGQRVFDIEIRAQALHAGASYTGPTPPTTGLGAWGATKTLGGAAPVKKLGGCGEGCECGPCKSKRPPQHQPPPAPAPGPQHHHHHQGGGHPPPPPRHVPPPCVPQPGPSFPGPGMGALPAPRIPLAAMAWGS